MPQPLFVLNGPNLNMLGVREPGLYGTTTLAEIEQICRTAAAEADLELTFRQSNAEHDLVDWMHEAYREQAAVIINGAGLSFRSVPLLDAVKILTTPKIELHITNIHGRDEHHRDSILSAEMDVVIVGAGAYGYDLAVRAAARQIADRAAAREFADHTG